MAEEHSPSLREALSASFDADVGGATGGAVPPATEGTGVPSARQEQASSDSGPRADGRDASGRYAAKDGAASAAAGDGSAAAEPEIPDGYDPDVWNLLTPEARAKTAGWAGKQRETLAEREARLKGYEPLDRVLTQQRRDMLSAEFGGVDQALERIFQLSDWAGRDPAAFLQHIARQRGIDLASLAGRPQEQAQQQAQDPRAFVQQLVEQQLASRDVDQAYNAYMAMPGLEHRENPGIKRVMAALLQSGAASDYRQAYDMAAQAHPEIGPKLRAAEAAAAAKAEQARDAEAARSKANAAVSITGGPGGARAPAGGTAPPSVRAALSDAWDRQAGGRV